MKKTQKRACFKCAAPGGKPRRSRGMSDSYYSVRSDEAVRTTYLCDSCFVPGRSFS